MVKSNSEEVQNFSSPDCLGKILVSVCPPPTTTTTFSGLAPIQEVLLECYNVSLAGVGREVGRGKILVCRRDICLGEGTQPG